MKNKIAKISLPEKSDFKSFVATKIWLLGMESKKRKNSCSELQSAAKRKKSSKTAFIFTFIFCLLSTFENICNICFFSSQCFFVRFENENSRFLMPWNILPLENGPNLFLRLIKLSLAASEFGL